MHRIIPAATLVWCFQIVVSYAQPNVLLIISDDQAWTDYSFMGILISEHLIWTAWPVKARFFVTDMFPPRCVVHH